MNSEKSIGSDSWSYLSTLNFLVNASSSLLIRKIGAIVLNASIFDSTFYIEKGNPEVNDTHISYQSRASFSSSGRDIRYSSGVLM